MNCDEKKETCTEAQALFRLEHYHTMGTYCDATKVNADKNDTGYSEPFCALNAAMPTSSYSVSSQNRAFSKYLFGLLDELRPSFYAAKRLPYRPEVSKMERQLILDTLNHQKLDAQVCKLKQSKIYALANRNEEAEQDFHIYPLNAADTLANAKELKVWKKKIAPVYTYSHGECLDVYECALPDSKKPRILTVSADNDSCLKSRASKDSVVGSKNESNIIPKRENSAPLDTSSKKAVRAHSGE